MKTFACVSLQSTVKGFILFSFADRSLALLVQRCSTVFVTTLLALVSCSCVFDKNTRANINIGTTDEYVQFNMYCAREIEKTGVRSGQEGCYERPMLNSKQMFKWTDTIHQTMEMLSLTSMMVITIRQYLLQHSQPAANMFSTHKKKSDRKKSGIRCLQGLQGA